MRRLIISTPKKIYAGDQMKKYEMFGAGGKLGEEKCIQILGEKTEGKRPLGGPRLLCED